MLLFMTSSVRTIRLRLADFAVDPNDPDVMRRVLEVQADVLTFADGELRLWLDGTEVYSSLLGSVVAIEFPRETVASSSKTYSVDEVRRRHGKAYQRWTPEDEQLLLQLHAAGEEVEGLAQRFDRQPSAIRARLVRLGALAEGGTPVRQADSPPF
ncbi:hypothetical protein [Streptomyces sp. NBC_01716]|uniref:hypothetical protein n=1 Tax=Streptomyces sp. NBC_01716 TaxID=2975917 RepID=UPI002E2FB977|nr:hypothetical protein [Streptomyces sp. NBC_01716]